MKKNILILALLFFSIIISGAGKAGFKYHVKFCEEDVFEETAFIKIDESILEANGLNYQYKIDSISTIANDIKNDIQEASENFSVATNKITSKKEVDGIGLIMFFQNCQEYNQFYEIELMDKGDFAYETIKDKDYLFYSKVHLRTDAYYENSFLIKFLNEVKEFLKEDTDYFDHFEEPILRYMYSTQNEKNLDGIESVSSNNGLNTHVWNINMNELDAFEINLEETNVERVWLWYLLAIAMTAVFIVVIVGLSFFKKQ